MFVLVVDINNFCCNYVCVVGCEVEKMVVYCLEFFFYGNYLFYG